MLAVLASLDYWNTVSGYLAVLHCLFCEIFVLQIVSCCPSECILLNATSINFLVVEQQLQARSTVQQSTCPVAGYHKISTVGSKLYISLLVLFCSQFLMVLLLTCLSTKLSRFQENLQLSSVFFRIAC